MKKYFVKHRLLLSLICVSCFAQAQDLKFMLPSEEILQLADAARPPSISIDNNHKYMLYMYRPAYKALADLGQEEVRLAGVRVNPTKRIASATAYTTDLKLSNFGDTVLQAISGLAANMRITNITWSPKQDKIAFTNTVDFGVELWIIDAATRSARRVTAAKLNASLGSPYQWLSSNDRLLLRCVPDNASPLIDSRQTLPLGPAVSSSTGVAAQNRTYPDMLRNTLDEQNFDRLISSTIVLCDLQGAEQKILDADLYSRIAVSPDGNYIMVSTLAKPYSYIVPYSRFPQKTSVYNINGGLVSTVNNTPLQEKMPKGFSSVAPGRRSMQWRPDMPHQLYFVEALDSGDQAKNVEFRDAIYTWQAPFTMAPQLMAKTIDRYSGVEWATPHIALVSDSWYDTRNTKLYLVDPSINNANPKILWSRSYDDKYNDPGAFVDKQNEYGRSVLATDGKSLKLIGDGFTENGQFPFMANMDLKTSKITKVYISKVTKQKETIVDLLNDKGTEVLIRLEGPSTYPNYYVRHTKTNALKPLSTFKNPYTSLEGIQKQVIKYQRKDGVELSGTLLLPAKYDGKAKLPLLIWAYPQEFKDKSAAGQSDKNANEFTYASYGSFIYWVNKGYAVLDDASFPILGEGSKEPNDDFMNQLVANAEAAIDAVDAKGYIDRKKVAIGGHSYGAFMTANLLTHSNLFACGVARSGAYNRTLTPFGFQSEQRNYWDVPDMYNAMSPFMQANKMKTPLLLVHGDADNNPGTFTLQTERYFQALKGLGAPVRMVLLPREAHGYESRENIMHLLWEQDQFFTKYLQSK
jgi:dipeptidyl aminopeptidase/acylaminoacyl peptidase